MQKLCSVQLYPTENWNGTKAKRPIRDSRQRAKLTLAENMFISINNIYKLAGGYVWAEQQRVRTKPPIKIIFAI